MVGLYGVDVVTDDFLVEDGISLSQEVLRIGFGTLEPETGCIDLCCSTSSSDEAIASESGVERRKPRFAFSRSMEALLAEKAPNAGMAILDGWPALFDPVFMAVSIAECRYEAPKAV